jgi:TetR/AcrR family transcriptional regulator
MAGIDKRDSVDAGEAGTKERILTVARTEFASYGLAGARVDRIAEQAGVNKAMIYYYYESKEGLHTEVIRDHVLRMGEMIREGLEKAGTLEEYLEQVLIGHVQLVRRAPEFIPIMLREMADPRPEFLDAVAAMMQETGIPEVLRKKFAEGKAAGEIREFDPRQMVISLITMSIGYFIMSPLMNKVMNITDRDRFIDERKDAILDLFMNGVRVR